MSGLERLSEFQARLAESRSTLAVIGPSANMRYLFDYQALAVDRLTVALVTPSSAVMIMPDFDEPEFVELTGMDNVVPWADDRGPGNAIIDAFGRLKGFSGDDGVFVDDELPFGFFDDLRPHLTGRLSRASTLLAPMRMIKSAIELEKMQVAADVVTRAMDHALDLVEVGRTEREIAEEIRRAVIDFGGDSADYVLVQAGMAAAAPHHLPGEHSVQRGEAVMIDIGARASGYYSDITQQVFLGDPTGNYLAAYKAVLDAQATAIEQAAPGTPIEAIDLSANRTLVRHGFPPEARTGHGLGLDIHEPPAVVAGNRTPLTPGMVITVEPGIYVAGEYGIRIEDVVAITDQGARILTRPARPLVVKG
jgi:Xaa-Pro aminopeptidase